MNRPEESIELLHMCGHYLGERVSDHRKQSVKTAKNEYDCMKKFYAEFFFADNEKHFLRNNYTRDIVLLGLSTAC